MHHASYTASSLDGLVINKPMLPCCSINQNSVTM